MANLLDQDWDVQTQLQGIANTDFGSILHGVKCCNPMQAGGKALGHRLANAEPFRALPWIISGAWNTE